MIQAPPHVVLFYDATLVVQRRAVSGVLRYANAFGPWFVTLNETHARPSVPKDCRGILACAPRARTLEKLVRLKLPLVLVNLALLSDDALRQAETLPHVKSDSRAFGVQAADFFLARAPRTFVYVGTAESPPWDREREEAFVARIRRAGHEPLVFPRANAPAAPTRESVRLRDWLKSLPKPLSVFAANDARARQVLTACQLAGITVPYEAAILGVDNDEWLCDSTRPRLSSIPFGSEVGGFEAARILDGLMRHRDDRDAATPPAVRSMPPGAVVERESTDGRIVDDPIVGRALSFIHLNKGLDIRVADVAKAVGFSPGWTETRFRQTLGTSVIDEIGRARMKAVLRLVRGTETPFLEIARRCGFTNASTLCRLVKKETGRTPGELRADRTKTAI